MSKSSGSIEQLENLPRLTIYTDGGCLGNPGPGGYGTVLLQGEKRKELSGGYRLTTNNRMEMLAAIEGLRSLKRRCHVTLYTDSQYLVKSVKEGWAKRWRDNGWMKNRKEAALNPDLWGQLLDLLEEHVVEFRWVKGHSGDTENERCDFLAGQASMQPGLAIDEVYEKKARPIL